jgi:hypothetical protein
MAAAAARVRRPFLRVEIDAFMMGSFVFVVRLSMEPV